MSDDAVIVTRRAYEHGAEQWARRGLSRDFADRRARAFAALVKAAGRRRVLDLGCGPGFDAGDLTRMGLEVIGLDVTRAMLVIARRDNAPSMRGLQADSRSLPFRDGSLDAVWANASLLHLPKSQVGWALAEVWRVLRRGGVFFASVKEGDQDRLEEPSPASSMPYARYFAHYRAPEWSGLLERARFRIESQDIDNDSRPGLPAWIVTMAKKP